MKLNFVKLKVFQLLKDNDGIVKGSDLLSKLGEDAKETEQIEEPEFVVKGMKSQAKLIMKNYAFDLVVIY